MTTAARPLPKPTTGTAPSTLSFHKPGEGVVSRSGVIYGKSGRGKTTMLSSMPSKGLVIEVPQLEGAGSDVLAGCDNITVVPVKEWNELEDVRRYLESGRHDYKWVALDTITDDVVLARRKVVKERPEGLAADPHKLTLPERGQMNTLVEDLIYAFRTLPMFTFWLAQERTFENDEDETSFIGPAVPPGILTPLVSGALFVARLKLEHDLLSGVAERRLQLAPHPAYYTKVRTRPGVVVPAATRTLDFSKLIPYFAGKPGVELDVVEESFGLAIELEAAEETNMEGES